MGLCSTSNAPCFLYPIAGVRGGPNARLLPRRSGIGVAGVSIRCVRRYSAWLLSRLDGVSGALQRWAAFDFRPGLSVSNHAFGFGANAERHVVWYFVFFVAGVRRLDFSYCDVRAAGGAFDG